MHGKKGLMEQQFPTNEVAGIDFLKYAYIYRQRVFFKCFKQKIRYRTIKILPPIHSIFLLIFFSYHSCTGVNHSVLRLSYILKPRYRFILFNLYPRPIIY